MIDPVRNYTAEVKYKGKNLTITVVQGETLSNDWIDFGCKKQRRHLSSGVW
jgi:hypothetical protein